jgi:copper(I)-binding protein
MTRAQVRTGIVAGLLFLAAFPAAAQVEIRNAWVRGTVDGQTSTGAYMQLKSAESAALIGVECPLVDAAELHEMKMDGNVMKMRSLKRLELPAGRAVELNPGGFHIMLTGLKRALSKGDRVPIRLRIETKDKSLKTVEVNAEVRDLASSPR